MSHMSPGVWLQTMTKRGPPSKAHLKEPPREVADTKDEDKKKEDEDEGQAKKAADEEDQYVQLVQVCVCVCVCVTDWNHCIFCV